jgi:hypothetical protein
MSRIDIGFIAVMMMFQFPFVAVVGITGVHTLFGYLLVRVLHKVGLL